MLGRSVGILYASALGAGAFLIPAAVPPLDTEAHLPMVFPPKTPSQVAALPCEECMFHTRENQVEDVDDRGNRIWVQGRGNTLFLEFAVSEDGQNLELNHEPIFPISLTPDAFSPPSVYAYQVSSRFSWQDVQDNKTPITLVKVTGSGVSVVEGLSLSPQGSEMIPVKYTIFEIEGKPVDVYSVMIKLLRSKDGELTLMDVENIETPEPSRWQLPEEAYLPEGSPESFEDADDFDMPPWKELPADENDDEEPEDVFILPHPSFRPFEALESSDNEDDESHNCAGLPAVICRVRQMVAAKMHRMRKGGCGGAMEMRHRMPHVPELDNADAFPRNRFHHPRPHGGRHHRGHHHGLRFLHMFVHGFVTALVPTLAGVAVGVAVSILGLLVGRMVSYAWVQLVRGGSRGCASVTLDETNAEEGQALKAVADEDEEVEPLPLYEDSPAYEETEKEAN